MRDENSTITTTKKGVADPLPLLLFTYAFCMVVSSIVFDDDDHDDDNGGERW